MIVEFTKRSLRGVTLLTSQFFFALGVVLVALFDLLLMYTFGWRAFLFAIYLPLLVSFIFSLVCSLLEYSYSSSALLLPLSICEQLLPQPPPFLLVSGRKREAEEVMSEMLSRIRVSGFATPTFTRSPLRSANMRDASIHRLPPKRRVSCKRKRLTDAAGNDRTRGSGV